MVLCRSIVKVSKGEALGNVISGERHINALSRKKKEKEHPHLSTILSAFRKMYANPRNPLRKDSQLLYSKGRLCIPKIQMKKDLHGNHTVLASGHLGDKKKYLL